MKFCTKCGAQLNDNVKFCPKCGAQVNMSSPEAPVQQPAPAPGIASAPQGVPAYGQPVPKAGKKSPLPLILGILAGVIVLVIAGVFAFKKFSGSGSEAVSAEEPQTTQSQTVTETTAPAEIHTAAETPAEVETETGKENKNAADGFVSDWWSNGSQRSYYYTEKIDDSHLKVMYYLNRTGYPVYFEYDGEGIGTLFGNELHVDMYYTYRMSDMYGNSAERKTGPYEEIWQLVSELPEDYQLRLDEEVFANTGYPAPEKLSECKPAENYVVFRGAKEKDHSPVEEEIIWYSSQVCIDPEYISLDKDQLRIARNEIYARRGRRFSSADLQQHFDSCSWYYGYIEPSAFDENQLSEIEKYNVKVIEQLEDGTVPVISQSMGSSVQQNKPSGRANELNVPYAKVAGSLTECVRMYGSDDERYGMTLLTNDGSRVTETKEGYMVTDCSVIIYDDISASQLSGKMSGIPLSSAAIPIRSPEKEMAGLNWMALISLHQMKAITTGFSVTATGHRTRLYITEMCTLTKTV